MEDSVEDNCEQVKRHGRNKNSQELQLAIGLPRPVAQRKRWECPLIQLQRREQRTEQHYDWSTKVVGGAGFIAEW